MSQSLADILLHVVFSTKDRRLWIHPTIQTELYAYITTVCHNLECPVLAINGMDDHIHLLLSLDRTISVSQLIREIKSNSSRWIKTKGIDYRNFSWQSGYGIFSVARRNVNSVTKYISSQKEHHQKVSFKEEFLVMLQQLSVPYDEKILWD